MSYRKALKDAERFLEQAGVPDAGIDAWYLMEYVLKQNGISDAGRSWYFLHCEEEMPENCQVAYQKLLKKRGERIPLQQLTGEQEFMGISFLVNKHVLIPRQDTEVLVEQVLSVAKPGMKVLDVCTGSGCIIISTALLCPGIEGTGTDLSGEALKVAEENNRRQNAGVHFLQGDLLEKAKAPYDVIVSNPPYIPTKTIETLMEEVKDHEPLMALDGMEDGLHFYRRLAEESPAYLKPEGWLMLEIGAEQGEDVKNLLEMAGFCNATVKKDLAGLDRVVCGQKPPVLESV